MQEVVADGIGTCGGGTTRSPHNPDKVVPNSFNGGLQKFLLGFYSQGDVALEGPTPVWNFYIVHKLCLALRVVERVLICGTTWMGQQLCRTKTWLVTWHTTKVAMWAPCGDDVGVMRLIKMMWPSLIKKYLNDHIFWSRSQWSHLRKFILMERYHWDEHNNVIYFRFWESWKR